MDNKYVVFKREEFYRMMGALKLEVDPSIVSDIQSHAVDGAVVIRTQDIFATSGLWAYAHTIMTYEELISGQRMLGQEERANLQEAHRYFAQMAQEAQQLLEAGKAKIPD